MWNYFVRSLFMCALMSLLITACAPAVPASAPTATATAAQPRQPPAATTATPTTERSAPSATSAPVEALANSSTDVVGIWWFAQAGHKLVLKADGTYRVLVGSDAVDEGSYALDAGKFTWRTSKYCGDKLATYEAHVSTQEGKPISLRMQVVGSDACVDRARILTGIARFVKP
jgi:hypothetical protein